MVLPTHNITVLMYLVRILWLRSSSHELMRFHQWIKIRKLMKAQAIEYKTILLFY